MNIQAAIFDIDGTLCEISPLREKLIKREDWDDFHKQSLQEKPQPLVVKAAQDLFAQGIYIFIVTGRPLKWRDLTIQWLEANNVYWDSLFMRENDDSRPSVEFKKEILDLIKSGSRLIIAAYEDRPQHIAMYRKAGINVVPIINEEENGEYTRSDIE